MSELGISLKFIRNWKPEDEGMPITAIDYAIVSCASLGHTWRINTGEPFCGVCGAPNKHMELNKMPTTVEEAFGHAEHCNVWVDLGEHFHLDRSRECTCQQRTPLSTLDDVSLLKALVIAWDADQEDEFVDTLRAARERLGFVLAGEERLP